MEDTATRTQALEAIECFYHNQCNSKDPVVKLYYEMLLRSNDKKKEQTKIARMTKLKKTFSSITIYTN